MRKSYSLQELGMAIAPARDYGFAVGGCVTWEIVHSIQM